MTKHTHKTEPEYGEVKTQQQLGQLLRQQRLHLEMTLSEFYQSSGISTRLMSELERGKINSVGRLIKILNMLGLRFTILPRQARLDQIRSRFNNV
ncbi:MAG: hypothetical protein ACR2PR_02815 [Pseudohongiellaceae bacterium]